MQEIGVLVIVVLKARNLHDKYFWKQDAFAQVGLNGETKRTKVDVKGGQHPEWDEEIRVPVMKNGSEKNRKLEVSCWAKSPSKEENIGTGTIDLAETLKSGEFDDWVPLDINGVARGEVYLEMTFFSHAPAPSGLMVPKANLQRRPSKLSPAERLSRPVAAKEHLPPVQERLPPVQQKPQANEQLAAPSRTSPGRGGRESPLPPVPDSGSAHVPSALMPGRPHHAGAQSQQQLKPQAGVTHVPSILRPRNPKSSPTPIHGPPVEYNGVVPPQTYDSGSPTRTYTPVVQPPQSPYEDGPARYVSPPPSQWGHGANNTPGGFSFPVPTLAGAREPSLEYPPGAAYPPHPGHERHGSSGGPTPAPSFSPAPAPYQPPHSPFQQQPYPPQQSPFGQPPPTQFQSYPPPQGQSPYPPNTYQQSPPHGNNSSNLPDPYLLARYQTPLPLPPDSPTARNAPLPKVESTNPDNARLQAMRQAEEDAARRKEKEREDRERREKEDREREEQERREREDRERREREDRERREREDRERERKEKEERERRDREERERRDREQREREEQERKRVEEEAARRKAEEERIRAEEEAARRKREEEEAAARRKVEEERRRAEEEAARRKAQEQREREQKERERVLRRAEEEAARRREQERKDGELAQQMADEVKRAEEESARRKEQERKDRELAQQVYDEAMQQEERDRELARQLDRELNLQEGGGNTPGRW